MIRGDNDVKSQCSIAIDASKYHKGFKIAFYFTTKVYYIFFKKEKTHFVNMMICSIDTDVQDIHSTLV